MKPFFFFSIAAFFLCIIAYLAIQEQFKSAGVRDFFPRLVDAHFQNEGLDPKMERACISVSEVDWNDLTKIKLKISEEKRDFASCYTSVLLRSSFRDFLTNRYMIILVAPMPALDIEGVLNDVDHSVYSIQKIGPTLTRSRTFKEVIAKRSFEVQSVINGEYTVYLLKG